MIPTQEPTEPASGLIGGAGFEDNSVRRLFIRKVYAVLTLQLAFTAGIIAIFNGSESVNEYFTDANNRGAIMAIQYC